MASHGDPVCHECARGHPFRALQGFWVPIRMHQSFNSSFVAIWVVFLSIINTINPIYPIICWTNVSFLSCRRIVETYLNETKRPLKPGKNSHLTSMVRSRLLKKKCTSDQM